MMDEAPRRCDVIIRHGTVIDGSGVPGFAAGIDRVMVNGGAVRAGRHTGARPGRVLRRATANVA